MPAPVRTPLGASTVNRKWFLDLNTGTDAVPVWLPVNGTMDFKDGRDNNMEEDTDFDSGGFASKTKTGEAWMLEFKVARKVTAASVTAYDPGQEVLRLRSYGNQGVANSLQVRFYEMEPGGPRVEAYKGRAAVSYSSDGGGPKAIATASVKLDGQGALLVITHPDL